MVSVNVLRERISDFAVGKWILDSGAFSEISQYGYYRFEVGEYASQIRRWSECGELEIAVSQDWMCEPFILERTGLTIGEHQRLTIERYDSLSNESLPVPVMPVLQGYASSDYLCHLQEYGDRLVTGAWVGVGSVCRRNGNPGEILNILRGIKLLRSDLRLHGFGLKAIALESPEIRELLYSCDSMAWSYPLRFKGGGVDQTEVMAQAHEYQEKIASRLSGRHRKRVPRTAGAGNGQGRKPKWGSKTAAVRLPERYIPRLVELAREWERTGVE